MEHFTGSDYTPVYHGPKGAGNEASERKHFTPDMGGQEVSERVRALLGTPRLFALVRDDAEDETEAEVVAYGIALPDGAAATVGVRHPMTGRWISPHTAAARLHSELIWFGEGDALPIS
jgi:hypothetical protein